MGRIIDEIQEILGQPQIHPDSKIKDKDYSGMPEDAPVEAAPAKPKSELTKLVGYISFSVTALILSVAMLWTSCQKDPRAFLEKEIEELVPAEPAPQVVYKTKWKTKTVYRDRVQEVPVYRDRVVVKYRTLEELEPGCYPDWAEGRTYAVAPQGKVLLCYVDYAKKTIRSRLFDAHAPVLNSLR